MLTRDNIVFAFAGVVAACVILKQPPNCPDAAHP
jgi:hypothetical protein